MNDYLDDQKTTKRLPQSSIDKVRKRFLPRILPELGDTPFKQTRSPQQFKKWFHDLEKAVPLVISLTDRVGDVLPGSLSVFASDQPHTQPLVLDFR